MNQEAVLLAPYDMAILTSMDILITSESLSFISLGVWVSLNESITARQEVIRLGPDGHPYMPGFLNNLGLSLLCRFERRDDIDERIMAQRQVTPDSHPDKPGRLNNLGASFQRRFERLGDVADLNQAYRSRRCCGPDSTLRRGTVFALMPTNVSGARLARDLGHLAFPSVYLPSCFERGHL